MVTDVRHGRRGVGWGEQALDKPNLILRRQPDDLGSFDGIARRRHHEIGKCPSGDFVSRVNRLAMAPETPP